MKDSIFTKIKMEFKYLTAKDWTYEDVGLFWDRVAHYDDINKEAYSYYRRFTDGYKYSSIADSSYVLDICSRTGNGTKFFWQKGKIREAVCADCSKGFQAICSDILKKEGIPFRLQYINRLPLPFKNDEFDAVLSFETIEHLSNPSEFIKEISRAVKKKGQVIITTPNVLWEPVHSLAAIFNLHHSEGPHRFIRRSCIIKYINDAGLNILKEKTTVFIPGGPKFLVRFGEWFEKGIGRVIMPFIGLRRIFICEKR